MATHKELADLDLYLAQRRFVKDMVNSAKMKYYTSLIKDSKSDQKKLFRTIDQLLYRKPVKLYPSCSSDTELALQTSLTEKLPRSGSSLQLSKCLIPFYLQLLIHLNLTVILTHSANEC